MPPPPRAADRPGWPSPVTLSPSQPSPLSQTGQHHPGRQPAGPDKAVLADGTALEVRAIRPDDTAALVDFHRGLSFETVYRRFFGVHPRLSPGEAEHFCTVDSVDRFALVAVVNGQIVGVARMERIEPASTAEVAFVVADKFQQRGLGRLLAHRLAAAGRERGVQQFVADTLPDNQPMLHLLSDAGFEVTVSMADGVARLTCPIGPAGD
jgi:RimJ/RimL family protein N-acetyltransferase